MKTSTCRIFLGLIAVVVLAAPAAAQGPEIDYFGYAWVTPNPVKTVGDELEFVGVADFADALFGVDLGVDELTFYFYDLISTGDVPLGGGATYTSFTGGMLEIWRDGAQNADWGINPPSPVSPSTFTDGSLFFRGEFNYFDMYMTADGAGSFEGTLDGLAGEVIASVCNGCAYTVGGSFTEDVGAQIPEGYVYQMDGVFEIDPAVATETSNWGSVKALFRD